MQEGLWTAILLERLIHWAWLEVSLVNPMGSSSPEPRFGGFELLWVWVDLRGELVETVPSPRWLQHLQ